MSQRFVSSAGASSSHLPSLNLKRLIPQESRHTAYYNTIKTFVNEGNGAEAEKWLRKLVGERLTPTVSAYNMVMSGYARKGQIQNVIRAFESISADGMTHPNVTSYNIILEALARDHDTKLAQLTRWYGRLCRQDLEPDAVTFSLLINSCVQKSNLHLAKHYIKKCVELNLTLSIDLYKNIINACAKAEDALSAVEIVEIMVSQGAKPDAQVHQAVVHAFCAQNNPKAALSWFNNMRDGGFTPDSGTWSSVIGVCARNHDEPTARRLMQDMQISGTRPDAQFFSVLKRRRKRYKI